ncbi:MAG: Na/Pi cotransporter family protein [Corallincola sp.]|nr:Na/Pi cotransporter family protein [Corallincola sp.]
MKRWLLPILTLLLLLFLTSLPSLHAIAAGVAIFLFGMLTLEEGFKALTGGTLERLLALSTASYRRALLFGTLFTAITQSSSLVSLITISFVSAGLISLAAGIGIIFGANLGTTTGAWLMAGFGLKVDIAAFAMPLLALGVFLALQKAKRARGLGLVITGTGLLFLGIHYMKEGFEQFSAVTDLSHLAMGGIKGLLIYCLAGIIITVVMQSSHATLLLVINALAVGQLSFDNALALCIGSNVGTTLTALISAISANSAGRRLASAHILFNLTTGVVALLLIEPLALTVKWLASVLGFGSDLPLQLALFHTLFNGLGVMLFSPLLGPLVQLLERLFRREEQRSSLALAANRSDQRQTATRPRYLGSAALLHADTALQALILEMRHLFDNAIGVITHGLFLHRRLVESEYELAKVVRRTPVTDQFTPLDELYGRYIRDLYAAIVAFAARAQAQLSSDQHNELFALKSASRDLVNAIKDVKHLQKNLVRYSSSDNSWIAEQYLQIRVRLAALLRAISRLEEDREEPALLLSRLRLQQERDDILKNGVLDGLIRDQRITSEMTASLLNDSHYVASISSHLIGVAELLLTTSSAGHPTFTRELSLEPEEMAPLLDDVAPQPSPEKQP